MKEEITFKEIWTWNGVRYKMYVNKVIGNVIHVNGIEVKE